MELIQRTKNTARLICYQSETTQQAKQVLSYIHPGEELQPLGSYIYLQLQQLQKWMDELHKNALFITIGR